MLIGKLSEKQASEGAFHGVSFKSWLYRRNGFGNRLLFIIFVSIPVLQNVLFV